jgi:beta-xylosidase
MIEAVKFWNEPNNKSHWDPEVDPGWVRYAEMVKLATAAVKAEAPRLTRVLGGISPIDPSFIQNLSAQGVLDTVDAVAVHGSRWTGTTGNSTNGRNASPRSKR